MPTLKSLPLHLAAAAALWAATTSVAHASVVGRHGVEIEGPQDRRGFFVGAGIGFGATFFASPLFASTYKDASNVIPSGRLELTLGGGVSKNITLGVNLYGGFFSNTRFGTHPLFGGDVEGRFYVIKGFHIRTGLGAAGVPSGDGSKVKFGVGGLLGLGYEFWLNQTAALAVTVNYDLRAVPGDGLRHTPYLGVRFAWY